MGCGSSIPTSSSINPQKSKSSTTIKTTNTSTTDKHSKFPSIHQRRDNLEPLTLVLLNDRFNENDKQLRAIIDYVIQFDHLDECEQYLTDPNLNTFIFLIISSENLHPFISRIHHLSKIHSIYLIESNQSKNYSRSKRSLSEYPKVCHTERGEEEEKN